MIDETIPTPTPTPTPTAKPKTGAAPGSFPRGVQWNPQKRLGSRIFGDSKDSNEKLANARVKTGVRTLLEAVIHSAEARLLRPNLARSRKPLYG